MMNRDRTRQLLKEQGLAPHKKLGQNFLVDRNVPRRIVDLSGVQPTDRVIEVGVGLGALTIPLAEAVAEVIGIEADSGIIRLHEQEQDLPKNVSLIHADILKVDFSTLVCPDERLKIVANLPYSISSPFIFRLLEQAEYVDSAVVMLQKEMAVRLAATPGSKNYGAPSVLLAAQARINPLFDVPPDAFHPRPKVDSQVIRIAFQPQPQRVTALGSFDRRLFSRVVHAAFGQRRKTLVNALAGGGLGLTKPVLQETIHAANLTESVRAETLELEDFVRLSRAIGEQLRP